MWLSLIFIAFAGIANACMDVLKTRRWCSSLFRIFRKDDWFNPAVSWRNKWKNGDPLQGERFLGSSTFLVWLTDAWHFLKMIMIVSICLSVIAYVPLFNWYVDLILLLLAFTLSFELFYGIIFSDK